MYHIPDFLKGCEITGMPSSYLDFPILFLIPSGVFRRACIFDLGK